MRKKAYLEGKKHVVKRTDSLTASSNETSIPIQQARQMLSERTPHGETKMHPSKKREGDCLADNFPPHSLVPVPDYGLPTIIF